MHGRSGEFNDYTFDLKPSYKDEYLQFDVAAPPNFTRHTVFPTSNNMHMHSKMVRVVILLYLNTGPRLHAQQPRCRAIKSAQFSNPGQTKATSSFPVGIYII